MATAWSLYPTAQTVILEPIILPPHSRQKDLVRHPPIMSFAKLRLAPDELGYDPKSPMVDDFIGGKMILVWQSPKMQVTAFSGELRDWESP
jgi:hypothetical protein